MRSLRYLFIFVLLLSQIFAAQVWKLPVFAAVEAKPVFFDDKMAIASYDGTIYYAYWQTGDIVKKAITGEEINFLKMGNGFIVAASGTKILLLDKSGNILRTINETTVYGIDVGDYIYATTDKGLEAISYENGNSVWIIPQGGRILTAPVYAQDRNQVIFGSGTDLVVAAVNGTELTRMHGAQFWKSRPELHDSFAYVGSTENKLYAFDLARNTVAWEFNTNGWVMSDPLYFNGNVYFGSNDGNIYALNSNTGLLTWKRGISEAVQGGLEVFPISGKDTVIVGGNDDRMYAFDAKTGDTALAISVGGWVHNPTSHSNMIFFGSYDGFYYAYIADRACSIDTPLAGDNIGFRLFNATGRVFSQYSAPRIFVRVSDSLKNGSWMAAQVSGSSWAYPIDPNGYAFGKVTIECKSADSGGEEKGNFTYVVLLRDSNAAKGKMTVFASGAVDGQPFRITAYDENSVPLEDFNVTFGGKTVQGSNGSVTMTIKGSGDYAVRVTKVGYDDYTLPVSVGYDMSNLFATLFVVFAIAAVAFYMFVYKRNRKL